MQKSNSLGITGINRLFVFHFTYSNEIHRHRHFQFRLNLWIVVDKLLHNHQDNHTNYGGDECNGICLWQIHKDISVGLRWKQLLVSKHLHITLSAQMSTYDVCNVLYSSPYMCITSLVKPFRMIIVAHGFLQKCSCFFF